MKANALSQAMAKVGSAKVAEVRYAAKGFHVEIAVAPADVGEAAAVLDREGFFIEAVTGVDWLGEQAAAEKAAKAAATAAAKKAAESGESSPAEPAPSAVPALPAEDQFEVVYDFNHYEALCRVTMRARVPRSLPELPTISDIFPGANWHERETHDFFGIVFVGHPCLAPLLLPEDADFHPLRKDHQA